jgi:hypothetical protein
VIWITSRDAVETGGKKRIPPGIKAKAWVQVLGPGEQLFRICADAESWDRQNNVVWFALNDDRPLFAFAGICTEYRGDRGTKSNRSPALISFMAFWPTSPNAVVQPIHPKATLVILTTRQMKNAMFGCARLRMKPRRCKGLLLDLKSRHLGSKMTGPITRSHPK